MQFQNSGGDGTAESIEVGVTTITGGTAGRALFVNTTGGTLTDIPGGDLVVSRYAAKQLMISGDGTGATTNAGWIIGYFGSSTSAGMWNSTVVPSSTNYTLFSNTNTTYLNAPTGGTIRLRINDVTKLETSDTNGLGVSITAGTATTDVAALSVTRTNNNAAVATGVQFAFTDTTSAAGFLPFQVLGGAGAVTNLLSVSKAGLVDAPAYSAGGSAGVDFGPSVVTSITVKKGIVIAIS